MARKIIFKSKVKRATGVSKAAWEAGLRKIAPEMQADIKKILGKQTGPLGPPAPKFKPPRRRSGDLQQSARVHVRSATRGKAAELIVTGNEYSRAQEFGRPEINMGPHPYARVVMLAGGRRGAKLKKKWADKIARAAKTKASKSTRSKTGNRRRR